MTNRAVNTKCELRLKTQNPNGDEALTTNQTAKAPQRDRRRLSPERPLAVQDGHRAERRTVGRWKETSLMDKHALAHQLQDYFEVQTATGWSMREKIYRLRYEVYCKEFGFEREEDCPGGLEQDPYDSNALHCALVHKSTGAVAGSVRLVRPSAFNGETPQLPMQRFCGDSLNPEDARHPSALPLNECCEISRLAVHPLFRKRTGERQTPWGAHHALDVSDRESRTFPLIAVALFLSAMALMELDAKPNVFVMMQPRLARLLDRAGLHFTQVGQLTDYHGLRAAYYGHYQDGIEGLRSDLRPLYAEIQKTLSRR